MQQVLLEKLPVRQLVKQYPALFGTRNLIIVFTTARHVFTTARHVSLSLYRLRLPARKGKTEINYVANEINR
jgi:hypothetical protein